MSTKLKNHIANIGDIDVYADESAVQITVDGWPQLFMDRDARYGLQDLINALQEVVITPLKGDTQ